MDKIIVTGAAGFIGYHAAKAFLGAGYTVIGVDNLNNYYDVNLKTARLENLRKFFNFSFIQADISGRGFADKYAGEFSGARYILHLAAQAGVRFSLEQPHTYASSNVCGQVEILELARLLKVEHLVYASSSSVYGDTSTPPFKESENCDKPVSAYAATKKAGELLAYTYAHLYKLPCTGLRFFTVYGAWGRPDMSPWLFTKALIEGRSIKINGDGRQRRDFTYIDDIISGITSAIRLPPVCAVPHRLVNLGNNRPVEILELINILQDITGKKADIVFGKSQPGDVRETCADITLASSLYNFSPQTPLQTGMSNFVEWYKKSTLRNASNICF